MPITSADTIRIHPAYLERRANIQKKSPNWEDDLIVNLGMVINLLHELFDYLRKTKRLSIENLVEMRNQLDFIWEVLEQDVIFHDRTLKAKDPRPLWWNTFVQQIKILLETLHFDVTDRIDDYIELLEAESGSLSTESSVRRALSSVFKDIRTVGDLKGELRSALIDYKNRYEAIYYFITQNG